MSLAESGEAEPPLAVLTFYNLRNFLNSEDATAKGYKSPESVAAIVSILGEIRPDVLGVSEIGKDQALKSLNRSLKSEGLSYDFQTLVKSADGERNMALLSQFPVVRTNHQTDLRYMIGKKSHRFRRGILDVTLNISGIKVRLVGVHLKSKRATLRNEQELMRRNEAHLLRRHIDQILNEDSKTKLIVYGDFNDTRNSPTIKAVHGRASSPGYLKPLRLADSEGEHWTYFWDEADLYVRYDFVFANRPMLPLIRKESCYLYEKKIWKKASDHRPLVIELMSETQPKN